MKSPQKFNSGIDYKELEMQQIRANIIARRNKAILAEREKAAKSTSKS